MDWPLLGFQGLGQVVNVHPVFVHFPIALFPTAFFFYLIGILRKRHALLPAGRICLGLGFLSTLMTVLTGYWARESFPHGEVIHRMMGTHQVLGFTILALAAILMLWSVLQREGIPKASPLFLTLFGLTVLAILQNADLGGRMVFVEGAAVKTVVPHASPDHEHHH